MIFNPDIYVHEPKPLPVILLLDVSGSMAGEPIQQLNKAVEQMITSFSASENYEIEIQVAIITFGNEVKLHMPYTSASDINFKHLSVSGCTPMGLALRMAKDMIECKETTKSRAYRPAVILVSDGGPTDTWESHLDNFISHGRSSKCDRMAVAIGAGADMNVLNRFVEGCELPVLKAENAAQIREKFKYITMSVTTRSQSQNKNEVPKKEDVLVGDKMPDMSNMASTSSLINSEPSSIQAKSAPITSAYSADDEDDMF